MNILLAAWVPISHILDRSLLPFGPRGWAREVRHTTKQTSLQSQLERGLPIPVSGFIRISDGPDYPAGIACGYAVVWDVFYNHTSATYYYI